MAAVLGCQTARAAVLSACECSTAQSALSRRGVLQDLGKKAVAAVLGCQTARASVRPRPFLRLQSQNFAVQVGPCPSPLPRCLPVRCCCGLPGGGICMCWVHCHTGCHRVCRAF